MNRKGLLISDIETERLNLEALTLKHSKGMFVLWSSSKVCRYCPKAEDVKGNPIKLPVSDPKESDKIIDFFLEFQKRSLGFRWAMIFKETNEFVGSLGFNSLGVCSEIAYHMIPTFWGSGLMNEACAKAIEWAENEAESTTFEAFIEPDNTPSIRMIQRLGFSPTGESREGADRFLLCR